MLCVGNNYKFKRNLNRIRDFMGNEQSLYHKDSYIGDAIGAFFCDLT